MCRSASASSLRAGCMCWRRRRRPLRRSRLIDETLETLRHRASSSGRHRRHRHPTGNALRGYEIGEAARAAGATVVYGGIHATLYPEEARELGGAHAVVTGDGERVWPEVAERLRGRRAARPVRGRTHRGRYVPAGAVGSAAGGALHVGVGADGARLPEALLVLLGLADGRPGAARSGTRPGGRRDRRAAAAGLPLHRARRRQFLSGHARGPARWPRGARNSAAQRAAGDPRRAVRVDGARSRSCPATRCSSRRSRWRRPRIPSSSTRCGARTSRARSSASRRSRRRA